MPLPALFEWAVWAHLDEIKNTELVLLKGHLLLELALNSAIHNLDKDRAIKYKDLSFHKKLQTLELLQSDIESDLTISIEHLKKINHLRNRLAHQFKFDNGLDELGKWSEAVLVDFPGTKISKHTYRTKIVQAFASLARVILVAQNDPNVSAFQCIGVLKSHVGRNKSFRAQARISVSGTPMHEKPETPPRDPPIDKIWAGLGGLIPAYAIDF